MRLLLANARYHIMREMEFPANFFVAVAIHMFFILANLAFFSVIWYRVGGFGGLTPDQMLFFLGTFHLTDGLFMLYGFFSIINFPRMVREGELDFVLTKPVESQFLVSTKSFGVYAWTDLGMGILLLSIAVSRLNLHLSWGQAATYGLMVINGAVLQYALNFIAITSSFWLIQGSAPWAIMFETYTFATRPAGIYPGYLKIVLTIFLPLLVVINFPTYFIVGRLSPTAVLWAFIATGMMLYLSHRFWRLGLRSYQSASS